MQTKQIETYATENDILFKSIEDVSRSIKGDVNNDGEFNVADVVLLQKWLLAVPNTYLANWRSADLCNDDKLNVFDLCLMKRELLQQTPQEDITLQGTIRFDMMGSSTPVVVYTDQLSELAQSHMYEGDSVDNVPWEKLTMNTDRCTPVSDSLNRNSCRPHRSPYIREYGHLRGLPDHRPIWSLSSDRR